MDPNENLRRQRETLEELRELQWEAEEAEERGRSTGAFAERQLDLLTELSQLVEDLDEWLSKGGFLPGDWQAARTV